MGWLTLQSRKQTLIAEIHDSELQCITLSRELRSRQRHTSYEQTILNNEKTQRLREIKSQYDAVKDERPESADMDSNEYKNWLKDYEDAKEDYEYEKLMINDEYDELLQELEEESTDKETEIQEQQATLEANLEAMRNELKALDDQISSDIESQTVNFGN